MSIEKKSSSADSIIIGLVCSLFFILWSYLHQQIYLNTDTAWLLLCLERFLQGGTYSLDFYETNPPLNFLIYLPTLLVYKLSNWPIHLCFYLNIILYVSITFVIFMKLIKLLPIDKSTYLCLLACFLFTQTWLMGPGFGLKDHLVYLWLLPFAALQYFSTMGLKSSKRLTIIISTLGALAICLKPYYVFIPACLLLHRLMVTKNIRSLFTVPDTLVPVLIGLSYLAATKLFFPDYFTEIIPSTLNSYSNQTPLDVSSKLSYLVFPAIGLALSFVLPKQANSSFSLMRIIVGLCILSTLCFIIFYMQNKGFHYQTFPALGFGVMAFMLGIYGVTKAYIKDYVPVTVLSPLIIMTLITQSFMLGQIDRLLTPSEFTNLPLHQKIEELAWNKIYGIYEMESLNQALPFYTDLQSASRFGRLWPLMGLSQKIKTSSSDEEEVAIKKEMQRYVGMIAEDIERFRPSLVAIPQYYNDETGKKERAFLNFMKKNIDFERAMQNYVLIETATFDNHLFVKGAKRLDDKDDMITYDLFIRNKETQANEQKND